MELNELTPDLKPLLPSTDSRLRPDQRKAKDSCGRDVWLTNGTYWKLREDPGFAKTERLTLCEDLSEPCLHCVSTCLSPPVLSEAISTPGEE
ncbi:hypothetical protein PAMP_009998 [Pampus punctatissimus]